MNKIVLFTIVLSLAFPISFFKMEQVRTFYDFKWYLIGNLIQQMFQNLQQIITSRRLW